MREVESYAARERAQDMLPMLPASRENGAPTSDRYVVGGAPWENYSHRQMFDMLHEDADLSEVYETAARWRAHGEAVAALADRFGRLLASLTESWTGASADSAISLLEKNTRWLAELARTTTDMAASVDEAAHQLAAAQRAMPVPRDSTEGAAAGALASVVDAVTGGITSVMGTMLEDQAAKDLAVRVMRDHEHGSQYVDDHTPQFLDAIATIPGLVAMPAIGRTTASSASRQPAPKRSHDARSDRPGDPASGAGAAQTSTAPSWATAGPEARWRAMTSASATSGVTVGNQPVGGSAATQAAVGGLIAGGGSVPTPIDRTASRTPAPDNPNAVGSARHEDDEHHLYPYHVDLFGSLEPSAPAVIGE